MALARVDQYLLSLDDVVQAQQVGPGDIAMYAILSKEQRASVDPSMRHLLEPYMAADILTASAVRIAESPQPPALQLVDTDH